MLDYQTVRNQQISLQELVEGLTQEDLRRELSEVYATIENLLAGCIDKDAAFQPVDPIARDDHAISGEETMAWTLGHAIVHLTASMEESASLAQELARGVEFHGRSRWEVPFRQANTLAFCRQRLAESRRMALASLEMWPDPTHLDNTYVPIQGSLPHTAVSRFACGLKHASDHLGQIAEIIRQARESRKKRPGIDRSEKAPV